MQQNIKPWRIISADVFETLTEHDLGGPFDAVLSDPPYGLGFMGKGWDHGVPSTEVWAAMIGHLRPGALVALFGGTRTYHRLTCAVEDAGFDVRDSIAAWLYGSGMPKPANVSRYIDKRLGKERGEIKCYDLPVSDEAAQFDGYQANLAPAWEPCVIFRKPLDGGLANNALTHGLAGYNVGGCKTGLKQRRNPTKSNAPTRNVYSEWKHGSGINGGLTIGRWPANVVVTCDESVCGPGDVHEIEHNPNCHMSVLHGQSVNASKFFYCGKVSRAERSGIAHPCMKPIALTEWLARLLLPPLRADGRPRRILVPYSGSGSEMIGALRAGWDEVVGIEFDAGADNPSETTDHWAREAERRISIWVKGYAAELDLADELDERGFILSSRFKETGIDVKRWIKSGYVVRNETKRTKLIPGPKVMEMPSVETREWYRAYSLSNDET